MLAWHPFALKFPLLVGDEWELFKSSIRKTKGNAVPVIYRTLPDGTRQGIDGRNRHVACEEEGLKCRMEEEIVDDTEVVDFILVRNLDRRHMTREMRQELVAELRSQGMSTRAIGERLGVSQATVVKDLKNDESEHKNSPEIIGADGRLYSSTHVMHCSNCRKHGIKAGCKDCVKFRKKKEAEQEAKRIAKTEIESPKEEPRREPGDDSEIEREEQRTATKEKAKTPKAKALSAVGVLVRSLEELGLLEKHRTALQAIKDAITRWKK